MLKNINQTKRNWSTNEFGAHGYYEANRPDVYKIYTEGYEIRLSKVDHPYYGDGDVTYITVISTSSRMVDCGTGIIISENKSILFRNTEEFETIANNYKCFYNKILTSFVKNIIKEIIEES